MAALTFAAVTGSLKAAADTVKSMVDLRDSTVFLAKANELQRQISAALADAIAAYESQMMQLQRVSELEEQVANFETWNAEKERYDLKDLGNGATAYMLKPDARGTEPPTWICTNCYEHKHKATLQNVLIRGLGYTWTCPKCKNTIAPNTHVKWLD